MASGGRRQGNSSRSWMASAFKIAGLGLAVAYAVKRAYDYFQEDTLAAGQPTTRNPRSQATHGRNPHSRQPEQNHTPSEADLEGVESDPQLFSRERLLEELTDYENSYVQIPEDTANTHLATLNRVRDRLNSHLEPVYGTKLLSAETAARLRSKVITPDCLVLLLPLSLDTNAWELVDGMDTLLETPGYYLVRRTNLAYFEKGTLLLDQFVVGGYLSPVALKQHLCRLVREEITWMRGDPDCGPVRPVYSGSDVVLEVQQDRRSRVKVRVEPCLALPGEDGSEVSLVSRPHPGASSLSHHNIESPYSNLWRQSFPEAENRQLQEMESTQLSCLKLLEAIRLNNAPLQTLTSHHFRMLFFRFSHKNSSWEREDLVDRLIDFLRELELCLEQGFIPNYFNEKVNLLEGYDRQELTSVSHWIAFVLSDEYKHFFHLLKKNY